MFHLQNMFDCLKMLLDAYEFFYNTMLGRVSCYSLSIEY